MDNNFKNYKKKEKDENFNGGSNWRSNNNNYNNYNNKRSFFGNGWRQQSILSLEKEFCRTVGGVPWKKVLDTQKYMYQDEKVLQWNDSAVQEAYWNAKKRFLAKMLNKPCNIELPDPDIFIDEIDWNADGDTELMLEVENRDFDVLYENDRKYSGVIVGLPVVPEQYVFTSGWGDAEEANRPLDNLDGNYGWVDKGVNNANKDCSNSWEDGNAYNHVPHGSNSWEDGYANHNVPHDKWRNNQEEYRHNNSGGSAWNGCMNKQWQYKYNKNSNFGGRNTARYKDSSAHYNRNDQPFIHDYGGRKRGNFSNSERPPLIQWRPVLRQR